MTTPELEEKITTLSILNKKMSTGKAAKLAILKKYQEDIIFENSEKTRINQELANLNIDDVESILLELLKDIRLLDDQQEVLKTKNKELTYIESVLDTPDKVRNCINTGKYMNGEILNQKYIHNMMEKTALTLKNCLNEKQDSLDKNIIVKDKLSTCIGDNKQFDNAIVKKKKILRSCENRIYAARKKNDIRVGFRSVQDLRDYIYEKTVQLSEIDREGESITPESIKKANTGEPVKYFDQLSLLANSVYFTRNIHDTNYERAQTYRLVNIRRGVRSTIELPAIKVLARRKDFMATIVHQKTLIVQMLFPHIPRPTEDMFITSDQDRKISNVSVPTSFRNTYSTIVSTLAHELAVFITTYYNEIISTKGERLLVVVGSKSKKYEALIIFMMLLVCRDFLPENVFVQVEIFQHQNPLQLVKLDKSTTFKISPEIVLYHLQ